MVGPQGKVLSCKEGESESGDELTLFSVATETNNDKIVKIISKISSCSFGVYLMHMLVYRFLKRYLEEFHWEWRLLVPFAIYFIALSVTYLLKKIPFFKNIVP